MNWDDVRIFLAVARSGQILGAARSLNLNHATVARRLTALETALGSTLFTRRTNGSDLSPSGERFDGMIAYATIAASNASTTTVPMPIATSAGESACRDFIPAA